MLGGCQRGERFLPRGMVGKRDRTFRFSTMPGVGSHDEASSGESRHTWDTRCANAAPE
jgi:hypothetical protein